MQFILSIAKLHKQAKQNIWFHYFTIFNRIALAAGFIPSGMMKILGERFTALSSTHPLGYYFDALHHTGYYYTFIGVMQVLAAILILIPRTVLLGALIYFPIILNIVILTFSVRFDGSLFTSPLMLMATTYLLFWNYDKLKYIVSTKKIDLRLRSLIPRAPIKKFPVVAVLIVFGATVGTVLGTTTMYDIMPKNTLSECVRQFGKNGNANAAQAFCECVHINGNALNICMDAYWAQTEKN